MSENMKPSGADYLSEIPKTWDAKRMKYCAEICNGAEYADIVVDEGGFPVMGSGGEFARANKYCYTDKSVLLGRKGTIDKPLFIEEPFWCVDTMFYTKMNKGINAKYLYYCSLNIRFDYYVTSTALPSMTQRDLGSEKIAIPPLLEQTIIADFLDEQCEKIDSIATDLEKQIEILQKYKKSLITETVTKGLDKSVSMKDSGIEWIGDIPEHWEVKKMKLVSNQIGDIDHYMPESVDIGIPYVMTGDFIGDKNEIDFENCKKISNQDFISLSRKIKPQKGDVLFARYATIGTVRYVEVDIDFLVSYACLIIKPTLKIMNGKFLYYYCFSDSFVEEVSKFINTNTQANVGSDSLNRVKITVPPLEEQNQIANHLDQQCSKIDSIIESKKEQLGKIAQHKKSLIYEYVTGKKRVKGAHSNGN